MAVKFFSTPLKILLRTSFNFFKKNLTSLCQFRLNSAQQSFDSIQCGYGVELHPEKIINFDIVWQNCKLTQLCVVTAQMNYDLTKSTFIPSHQFQTSVTCSGPSNIINQTDTLETPTGDISSFSFFESPVTRFLSL